MPVYILDESIPFGSLVNLGVPCLLPKMSEELQEANNFSLSRQSNLISQLEKKFGELHDVLYPTNVPNDVIESKAMPYVAEDVVFHDPWNMITGKTKYLLAMKGYHNIHKNGVDIGRCMVDGTMYLQMAYVYKCPLRVIVVYDFRVLDADHPNGPKFEIFNQQEMWSYMEMIQGIPIIGWIHKNVCRPVSGQLFVAASYLSCMIKGTIKKPDEEQENMNQ
uniref:Uncharacterized protein n=1 Tax=Ditylenchus dipsaci TaxID=166011 RepID=A0A915ENS7_9BILA